MLFTLFAVNSDTVSLPNKLKCCIIFQSSSAPRERGNELSLLSHGNIGVISSLLFFLPDFVHESIFPAAQFSQFHRVTAPLKSLTISILPQFWVIKGRILRVDNFLHVWDHNFVRNIWLCQKTSRIADDWSFYEHVNVGRRFVCHLKIPHCRLIFFL